MKQNKWVLRWWKLKCIWYILKAKSFLLYADGWCYIGEVTVGEVQDLINHLKIKADNLVQQEANLKEANKLINV